MAHKVVPRGEANGTKEVCKALSAVGRAAAGGCQNYGAGKKDRILSTAWALGDCNNQFVLMIVSKEGELVFLRKGVLSEADKQAFYATIDKYK